MEKNKTKKRMVKKAKQIRSMIMMTLVCVLMLSAATYAWFTLSNTAKVSNLTMTVGDVTGLQVADYDSTNKNTADKLVTSDWKSQTSEVTFNGKLLPATTTDGKSIYEPVYGDDGSVTGIGASPTTKNLTSESTATDEGYYVEFKFWIRAQGEAGKTTSVKLDPGADLNNGIKPDTDTTQPSGTYSISSAAGTDSILPSSAVRISFVNDDSVKVFEPNSDFSTAATAKATDSRASQTAVSSNVTQNIAGVITSDDSTVLTLTNNTPTLITLNIWLEGTDAQCGNEIAAKNIITQLKLSTVDATPST